MKIAFLLTQLEIGGAQVRVMQTAAELRNRGHEVDVIFLYKKRDCFEHEQKIILSNRSNLPGILRSVLSLYELFRSKKYDVLFTNTAPANIIGNTVALFAGVKKRIAYQTQPPARLNKIYRLLDLVVGSIGIYKFNITNSQWTRDCFNGYPSRYLRYVHIIKDGIVPRSSNLSQGAARSELGIGSFDRWVLTIGRLSEQKGQDVLIRSLQHFPDAGLVIVGDGELRSKLELLVTELSLSDRVIFTGEVPGEKIALLLRAADIFAFPSRWETFGLAVVEAAASGLPIVASDLDVLKEVLSPPGAMPAAIFVKVDDELAFADAVKILLNDEALRQQMSKTATNLAQMHTMQTHVDNLMSAARSI